MLYTYIPSNIKCSVFGVELKGLAKDSMVTIERIDTAVTHRKAQDGSVTTFVDRNASYRVTFNIDQTSESNEFLHTVFKLAEKSGKSLKMPVTIIEDTGGGGTKFTATEAFFESEPMSEFGNDTMPRQWVIICHQAAYSIRGTVDSSFIVDGLKSTIYLIELAEVVGVDLSSVETVIDSSVQIAQDTLRNLF